MNSVCDRLISNLLRCIIKVPLLPQPTLIQPEPSDSGSYSLRTPASTQASNFRNSNISLKFTPQKFPERESDAMRNLFARSLSSQVGDSPSSLSRMHNQTFGSEELPDMAIPRSQTNGFFSTRELKKSQREQKKGHSYNEKPPGRMRSALSKLFQRR